jgi:hypothetical protein
VKSYLVGAKERKQGLLWDVKFFLFSSVCSLQAFVTISVGKKFHREDGYGKLFPDEELTVVISISKGYVKG